MNIDNSLNKGVPINYPVLIEPTDLIAIASNQKKMTSILENSTFAYLEFISRQAKSLISLDFYGTLAIVHDFEDLKGKIVFSDLGFYKTLDKTLNTNIRVNDYEELLDTCDMVRQFLERIEILKQVKTPNELKRKFPNIYQKYLETVQDNYNLTKRIIEPLNKLSLRDRTLKLITLNKELRKHSLYDTVTMEALIEDTKKFSFGRFIEQMGSCLTNLVNNKDKIMVYINNNPIDFNDLNQKDIDNLELYFAYQHLRQAKLFTGIYRQEYLYYVSNYFINKKDILEKDIRIVIGSKSKDIQNGLLVMKDNSTSEEVIITPKILYDMYTKLLVDNPDLKMIDLSSFNFEGMNLDEVSAFMMAYLKDLGANWDFLEPNSQVEEDITKKTKGSSNGFCVKGEEAREEKLLKLFMTKKQLYESTNPLYRIKGKNTFEGYIGYIYANGRVILDRFYDKQNDSNLALGHAVYAMNMQEFYELSKLSKTEIIRNNLCRRYVHRGNWAKKILENEIELKTGEIPTITVRKLIKDGSLKVE